MEITAHASQFSMSAKEVELDWNGAFELKIPPEG